MKQYLVKDIPVGSRFSRNLFLDGQFILGTPELPFSKELKDSLASWNFKEVFCAGELIEGSVSLSSVVNYDDPKIKEAMEFYDSFLSYLSRVFLLVKGGGKLDFQTIADKVQGTCSIIQNNRSFLLGLQKTPRVGEDYLDSHGVMSMIISMIIGLYLKLPEKRVVELGVAALLHEIGMLKIPPKVYLKKEELTANEWKMLSLHPIVGYKLLKSFNFPLAVSLVAREHHERENGSGYPQKLTAD
jgi:HD-GYP domain-containing protein (c-di-GMP phosphodiesterase class II)